MTSRSEIPDTASGHGHLDTHVDAEPAAPMPTTISPDADERPSARPASSSAILSTVGRVAVLLMRAQTYQHLTMAEFKARIMPAIVAGQFLIAGKRPNAGGMAVPVGAVLWARVSMDVDVRLQTEKTAPIKLAPEEWSGGDIIWITESVGEAPVVKAMIAQLLGDAWKGRTVRHCGFGDGGRIVQTLAEA